MEHIIIEGEYMDDIILSKKHGVNPSINMCFWCGNDKELILFGLLPQDKEAPMHVCIDYQPCDRCKEQWDKGITLIECSDVPLRDDQPALQTDAYPTGRYMVITEDAFQRIFNVDIPVQKIALLEINVYTELMK